MGWMGSKEDDVENKGNVKSSYGDQSVELGDCGASP